MFIISWGTERNNHGFDWLESVCGLGKLGAWDFFGDKNCGTAGEAGIVFIAQSGF